MDPATRHLIALALAEDLGRQGLAGDITSAALIPEDASTSATMVARESCVLSGVEAAAAVFTALDPSLKVEVLLPSGTEVQREGSSLPVLLTVHGNTRSLLAAERTALNFVQRLSGIATLTRAFVSAARGTNCVILDTRKTTPGWRLLEKQAVADGGGRNHRLGLHDRIFIKDNHLVALPANLSLSAVLRQTRQAHPGVEIEIEADTLDQVRTFLAIEEVDRILLDNMPLEQVREAVGLAAGSGVALEASGSVKLEKVAALAATGVDFISAGALTHSARAIDLALEFDLPPRW
ncbi:MAG TPA: carboxylating nicotinate-nucleotide diphosphorylase [Verrucomicrobiales bacterium]|nr:carboxylating nicotinate-nucleotide diphosphorylase [Verrucomicrobiales bacterium]